VHWSIPVTGIEVCCDYRTVCIGYGTMTVQVQVLSTNKVVRVRVRGTLCLSWIGLIFRSLTPCFRLMIGDLMDLFLGRGLYHLDGQ